MGKLCPKLHNIVEYKATQEVPVSLQPYVYLGNCILTEMLVLGILEFSSTRGMMDREACSHPNQMRTKDHLAPGAQG